VKFISQHLVLYSEGEVEVKYKICHLFLHFTLGQRQTVGCEPTKNRANFKKYTEEMYQTCGHVSAE